MNQEVKRILQLLKSTYNGNPWHGTSLENLLSGLTAQQASTKPLPACHSIWELVLHMIAWRIFAWNKLTGDPLFDINREEEDWPVITKVHEETWQITLQKLENSQQQLLMALKDTDDKRLEETVTGRNYTFYVLLHGVIQHDLYHSGQIALLKKTVTVL